MRNLKRALSMALAAIMVLGLMVVGASATSYEDFTDKDEIKNKEAVNTMVSLGVISGKEDGSYYAPADSLTRAEACTLIARMLGGGKDPVLGSNIKSNFTDTQGHWAENYIAYCANLGIIVGVGDGSFNPDGVLTGTAAAKMVLCALGYKPEFEGIGGANWELATNTLATKVKLYDGLDDLNPSDTISRDDVAQILYNGVQADEVEYRNLQGDYQGTLYAQPVNGTEVDAEPSTLLYTRFNVVKVEGVVVANDIMAIDDDGTTVSGKVRLSDIYVSGNHRVDGNGALISDTYPIGLDNSYLGQRVVLYVQGLKNLSPNASSTKVISDPILSQDNTVATTTNRMKDADAVRSFLSDNDLTLPANGVTTDAIHGTVEYTDDDTVVSDVGDVFTRDFAVTATANVKGTEFTFIDHDGDGVVDYIFKTLPKMAKVTVYNETDEELTIAGEGSIDFSDIANPEDVAKDDVVLYYIMNETYYLSVAETVAGKVTAYDNANKTVTMDGVAYSQSTVDVEISSTDLTKMNIAGSSNQDGMDMVDNTYTFYLDNSGNVVAWVLGDETVGNYAMVLYVNPDNTNGFESAKVKLLLADGTTGTYDVNLLASANRFDLSGTTAEKEAAMANILAGNAEVKAGDDGYNYAAGYINNRIVTYVVGEDGQVTLGNPTTNTTYESVDGVDNAHAVTRSTGSYTLNGETVKVNDSTLFFIRNVTDTAGRQPGTNGYTGGTTYSVVKGVSNLPTKNIEKSNSTTLVPVNATVNSAIYTTTSANPDVAKAVFVDGDYSGTANYVYVVKSYTGTTTVNGERVYTYPVVFEDGTEGTLDISSNNVTKEMVYEYTVDSNGVADVDATVAEVINDVVSTYSKGSNLTVESGDGSKTINKSYTIAYGAQLWNVEDTPYAETLTSDMDLALVLDGDGFVKTAFVKETNVTLGSANVSATATPAGMTVRYAVGGTAKVYSGYNIQFGILAPDTDVTYDYTVVMNNGKTEAYTDVAGTTNENGYLTISMPKNATSVTLTEVNGAAIVPAGIITDESTMAEVQAALNAATAGDTVTVYGTGDYTLTGTLTVPAGVTFNVPGTLTLNHQTINGTGTVTCGTVVMGSQIGAGLTIKATNAVIAGNVIVNGTLEITNSITVSENAPAGTTYTITMTVAGSSITVGGSVTANIVTAGSVTITGDLTGDVTTETGAQVAITGTQTGNVYGEESITVGGSTQTPDQATEVSAVAVTATEPKLGDKTLPTTVTTETTGAGVTGTWAGTTPVAAGTYTLTLTVYAGSGYVLADDVTVTVNGKAATAGAEAGTYTYTVTVSDTTEPVEVSAVEVTATEPKLGDEALPTDVTTETEGVSVTGTWEGTAPVAAGTYTLTLTVTADEGYVLADGATVTVNGEVAAAGEDGTYTYTIEVYEAQVAAIRGEGPGKAGTSVSNLKYGDIYSAAGVTLENNVLSVDTTKLAAFAKADATSKDTSYGGNGNYTALYHLTQMSSAGGKRLYIGLAFAAPEAFTGAKSVKVTVNGNQMTTDGSEANGSNEVFGLEDNIVSGTGSDTLNGVYIEYLPFANAPAEEGEPTADAMKLADADYEFVFTWLDSNGDVLGISTCTVSRESK